LVRALPCHGRGRGFESRRSRFANSLQIGRVSHSARRAVVSQRGRWANAPSRLATTSRVTRARRAPRSRRAHAAHPDRVAHGLAIANGLVELADRRQRGERPDRGWASPGSRERPTDAAGVAADRAKGRGACGDTELELELDVRRDDYASSLALTGHGAAEVTRNARRAGVDRDAGYSALHARRAHYVLRGTGVWSCCLCAWDAANDLRGRIRGGATRRPAGSLRTQRTAPPRPLRRACAFRGGASVALVSRPSLPPATPDRGVRPLNWRSA
jgi:hypothetical protein